MICPYCKCQLPENALFCQNCGADLKQYLNFPNQSFQTENDNQAKIIDNHAKNNKKIILIAILMIIILFIGFRILKNTNNKDNSSIKNEKINNNSNKPVKEDKSTNSNINVEIENDNNTSQPKQTSENASFLMIIEDVFEVANKGVVVTGTISRGTINVNDEVYVSGLSDNIIATKAVIIEKQGQELTTASAGMEVGIYLKDIKRSDVKRGQVITKDEVTTSTRIEASLTVANLEKNEKFRAIYNNSSIKIKINGIYVSGFVTMLDGIQMAMPGDSINAILDLGESLTIEPGTQFSIVNDSKNIGNGNVTKVY